MKERRLIETFFTDSELELVRQRTQKAELATSGELVSYAVSNCGTYEAARLRSVLAGALAGSVLAATVFFTPVLTAILPTADTWLTSSTAAWAVASPSLGALLGWFLGSFERIARHFSTDAEIDRAVQTRAKAAFLEEEVFNTEERTGLLLFLALFERRAVLLADSGLGTAVPQEKWQEVADQLSLAIGRQDAAQGLIRAIDQSEALLVEAGVRARSSNPNELDDAVRLRHE